MFSRIVVDYYGLAHAAETSSPRERAGGADAVVKAV